MAGALRVWVTRAGPGAAATAARLAAMGHAPLVAPVLEVRPIPGPAPDLEGVAALAFTSRNGVEAFAGRVPTRALPVFAVGEATAAAARALGFGDVASADGDVRALAALVVARFEPGRGVVLHPGALRPAGDLVGELHRAGVAARALALYDTPAAGALPEAAATALEAGALEVVLVHSPRAATALAGLLAGRPLGRMRALALSPACAAPLAGLGFAAVLTAAAPDEAALLARLPDGPGQDAALGKPEPRG